jgi:signal peptide peptidase SppA
LVSANFNVDRFLSDKPLAITAAGLEELRAHIEGRILVYRSDSRSLLETLAVERAQPQAGRPRNGAASSTGVIRIRGTISQHAAGDLSSFLFGGATCEGIGADLDAMLADDSISKIVLDIDSPGGTSYGVSELAAKIMSSRGTKPIIAVANSLAASAAYWIGAAADQFFVTPGGMVGSIGVYAMHQDVSKALDDAGVKVTLISAGKHKVDGHPSLPLDDETKQRVQERVDEVYGQFVHDVARGRGVPEATVRSGYGEGDVLGAKKAKAEGMVDGIMTLESVLAKTFTVVPTTGMKAENPLGSIYGVEVIPAPQGEPDEPIEDDDDDTETAEAQARAARFRFRARAAAAGAA